MENLSLSTAGTSGNKRLLHPLYLRVPSVALRSWTKRRGCRDLGEIPLGDRRCRISSHQAAGHGDRGEYLYQRW